MRSMGLARMLSPASQMGSSRGLLRPTSVPQSSAPYAPSQPRKRPLALANGLGSGSLINGSRGSLLGGSRNSLMSNLGSGRPLMVPEISPMNIDVIREQTE